MRTIPESKAAFQAEANDSLPQWVSSECAGLVGEQVGERLVAWLRSPDAAGVLAALCDPAKMLSAWERMGKLQRLSGADEAWDIGDRDAWCLPSQPKEKTGAAPALSIPKSRTKGTSMSDPTLEAIKALRPVGHWTPGADGTEEHVGSFVHLTPAQRDTLVAKVVQLRDALERLRILGRRVLTERDSMEQGEVWWGDLNHELFSPTGLEQQEGHDGSHR